jgi:MFS family permease
MAISHLARLPPGRFALVLLGLSFLVGVAGRGLQESYPVFVLPLGQEFGWSRAAISGVYAVSFVVVGFSGPLIGFLYDRFGAVAVYGAGLGASGLAAFLAPLCDEVWQLALTLGLLMGFGSACVGMVAFAALLSRWFRARLNLALAVAQSSYGTGILVMAPTAQILIDWQGWRAAYWCFGTALLALLPLLALVPWRRAGQGHPDYAPLRAAPGPGGASAAGGPSFRQALGDPTFWGIVWGFTFTGIGMYTVSLQVPAYLVSVGYTAQDAAEAYGLVGVLLPAGVIGFGWLSDRIRRRYAMALAYALSILGMAALLGLGDGPSLPLLALFVICFGGTFGSRGPAFLTIGARAFQGPELGRIMGGLTIGMGGGAAIGSWLGGALVDLTGGYVAGLWCGMASLALAYLPYLVVRAMYRS